jgi:head-tail adaptor
MADADFTSLLISSFIVKRNTETADGYGGRTQSLGTIGTYAGRLSLKGSSNENVRADQFEGKYTYELFLEVAANVQRDDIVTGEGHTLRVIFVREPSQMNHHYEVDCEELELTGGI